MTFTSYNIVYEINKSNRDSIRQHLLNCNNLFNPPLSSYVQIDEYSEKIFARATNFEAWHKDNLIGLVSIYYNDFKSKVAYISNVSVEAEFQKQGIASMLLSKAINYGAKLGFLCIKLEIYIGNKNVKALYSKLGFVEANIGDEPTSNEKTTMIKYI